MYIAVKEELKDLINESFIYISAYGNELDGKAKALIENLKSRGVKYFLSNRTISNLSNEIYIKLCKYNMAKATSAIIIIDDQTLINLESRQMISYETGLLQSMEKKIYYVNDNISENLLNNEFNRLPGCHKQLNIDISDVLKDISIEETCPKNLFMDVILDSFAKDRIFYIRIVTMLDIRYKDIKKKYEWELEDNPNLSLSEFMAEAEDLVKSGVRVLYFGGQEIGENSFGWPYENEMEELMLDFPVKKSFSKVVVSNVDKSGKYQDDDIVATLTMEYVLPSNEVLGVSFKPFFDCTKNSSFGPKTIKEILLSDGIDEASIKIDGSRIYFAITNNDMLVCKDIRNKCKEEYGYVCNYVFPK